MNGAEPLRAAKRIYRQHSSRAPMDEFERMVETDGTAIAVVGSKGEIIIPQELRRQLSIKPKSKLAVYRKDDKLVVVKLSLPATGEDLDGILRKKGHRASKTVQQT